MVRALLLFPCPHTCTNSELPPRLETKMTEEKSPEPGISTFSYDACENSTEVGLGVMANGDGCFNLPKITRWSESM